MQPPRRIDFKYNPGFKRDEDLERDFVVRKRELRSLLRTVRSNTGTTANAHVLIVGARGTGKTTLVRRLAAELRQNPLLEADWRPIVFGEESYAITSPGEFWLECLYQLQSDLDSPRLAEIFRRLRAIEDENTLFEAGCQALIAESETLRRRLVVIVENFAELTSQIGRGAARRLTAMFAESRRIMVVATSTTNLDQAEEAATFKPLTVGPLDTKDCRLLWLKVSGERLKTQQARPIQILTGGNPRLIRILAEFASDSVYLALVEKLEALIDQYTDYFKGQLENLPTGERKVFVSLLDLWDPALTREVAEAARMGIRPTSAYLDRLEKRGVVVRDGSRWQAAERLINIYYLMRRHGKPSSRVKALVRFMTIYYAPKELEARIQALAQEACDRNPGQRDDYYYMVSGLIDLFESGERRRLVSRLPNAFFKDPTLPRALAELRALLTDEEIVGRPRRRRPEFEDESDPLLEIMRHLEDDDMEAAQAILHGLRAAEPETATTRLGAAVILLRQGLDTEAETELRHALVRDPTEQSATFLLIGILLTTGRGEEAMPLARRLTSAEPDSALYWSLLGDSALDIEAYVEAETAFLEAHRLDPNREKTILRLATLADQQDDVDKAQAWFDRAMSEKKPELDSFLAYSDFLICRRDERDAERVLRRAVDLYPESGILYFRLALLKTRLSGDRQAARPLFERCLELDSDQPIGWATFGDYLFSMGDVTASKDAWRRAAALDDGDADLWFNFAVFLLRAGESLEAEDALRRSLEFNPESAGAWEMLGGLLARQSDRTHEAETALEKAIGKPDSECSSYQQLGELRRRQGRLEEARLNFEAALKVNAACYCATQSLQNLVEDGAASTDVEALLRKIVESRPDSARARYELARHLRRIGRSIVEVEELLVQSLARSAAADAYLMLAEVIFERCANPAVGDAAVLQAIETHPPTAEDLNQIAWRLHERYGAKRSELSRELAQRAYALNSSWDIAHTLAFAYLDAGDIRAALELLPDLARRRTERALPHFIDIIVALAKTAPKTIADILQILQADPEIAAPEPLLVALRRKAGEVVHVAKEVFEVSSDILDRMTDGLGEQRRQATRGDRTTTAP